MSKPTLDELRAQGGESEQGNFYMKDTIGVPHPYCIGPKHVAFAADHNGGMLSGDAIERAEKHGAKCCMPRCTLRYGEHETAILIGCRTPAMEGDKAKPELHQYLLKLKSLVEGHYAGFAFAKEWDDGRVQ